MLFPAVAATATGPDNTWNLLAPLPEALDAPIFALAVSPSDSQSLLAGTQTGSIYRSRDGGQSWSPVRRDPGHSVLAIAFNPAKPGETKKQLVIRTDLDNEAVTVTVQGTGT